MAERLGEAQRRAAGQRMARRHRHAKPVAPVGANSEPAQVDQVPEHAEIGGAFTQAAQDVRAHPLVEADADLRPVLDEGGDVVGQLLGERRRAGQHANAALHAGAEAAELDAQALEAAEDLAGACQQGLARRRRLDAATLADEQGDADLGLERGDALAQRRRHQGLALGRAGDAAFLADGDEVLERDGIERTVHGAAGVTFPIGTRRLRNGHRSKHPASLQCLQ